MQVNATAAEHPGEPLYLRVAWLCGVVLSLEGYDIAEVGYAIPSLVDAWHVGPSAFTRVLTAGNIGLLLGSLIAGLLGDRLGRRPVLIGCVTGFGLFSLLSALAGSPSQLAGLRFVTGLALGGGIPLAIALASDVAPPEAQRRLVVLMSVGVPVGFTVGGLLASQLVRLFGWPAIFVVGGALPLAMVPVLARWLPETMSQRPTARWHGQVAALFHNGLASSTALLWVISLLNLLCNYLILLWTPVLLHGLGISPSWSIFVTTMYALGVIVGGLLSASVVDRVGVEPVSTCLLALGAVCALSIGVLDLPLWLLSLIICGSGIGIGGCQSGVNSLSGGIYPTAIRSTGAGWALGLGRVGTVAGPLLGGGLLMLGWHAQGIFMAAALPTFGAMLLMATLGRVRGRW